MIARCAACPHMRCQRGPAKRRPVAKQAGEGEALLVPILQRSGPASVDVKANDSDLRSWKCQIEFAHKQFQPWRALEREVLRDVVDEILVGPWGGNSARSEGQKVKRVCMLAVRALVMMQGDTRAGSD